MKAGAFAEPALIGREHELEELSRSLEEALAGKGNCVFVSGEAGTGKSRLAKELISLAKGKNALVLSSNCLSDVAVPYFPFMEAFGTYFSTTKDDNESIRTWLMGPPQTSQLNTKEALTPQAWKELTFVAVTEALLQIASKRPTVLFIDDIQWADSASLALIHYISRTIQSAKILLLATFRSEELTADAEGKRHPLVETIRLMRREELFKEIKLANLDKASVSKIAEEIVGGNLDASFSEKISQESHGNALFVVESLRMLSEQGSLIHDQQGWHVSTDELAVPLKFKDIILRRINRLKFNEKRILDAASVIGERFSPELLAAVTGQDSLNVLETLNAIAQESSLVTFEGSDYRFDHAKSRQIIYDEIPPPLKKGYHARIAQRLEESSKEKAEFPAGDLAYHYAKAGNKEKSIQYSLTAGKDARARFSNAEAIKHFSYVLENTREETCYDQEKIAAQDGLADALAARGFMGEALRNYENLAANTDSGKVKLLATAKAMRTSFFIGNYKHSLELAATVQPFADSDRVEFAKVQLYNGMATGETGNVREATRLLEESIKVFKEEYRLQDLARALIEYAVQKSRAGKPVESLFAVLRAVKLDEELQQLNVLASSYGHLGSNFMNWALYEEGLEAEKKSIEIAEKVNNENQAAWALFWSVRLLLVMGKTDQALEQCLKALKYAENTDSYLIKAMTYGVLTSLFAKAGNISRAEEVYDKLSATINGKTNITYNLASSLVGTGAEGRAKASLLAAKGNFEECKIILEKTIRFQDSSKNSKIGIDSTQEHLATSHEAETRKAYSNILLRLGKVEEAQIQVEEAKKIIASLHKIFAHTNVRSDLVIPKEVGVGENFSIRLDIGNISKVSGKLTRIENILPTDFKSVFTPLANSHQNSSIELKENELKPFELKVVQINLQATKTGVYTFNPTIQYVDDTGTSKSSSPEAASVTVLPTIHIQIGNEAFRIPILPDRVPTGSMNLDALLMGGVPKKYSILLSAAPSDEREQLIKRFLEEGIKSGETIFYITTEIGNAKNLAESAPSTFYLFCCNLRGQAEIQDAPNTFKLKGVENLTDIDISILKALRSLNNSKDKRPRKAVIEIVSDVLLQHHALNAKKWLSGLLSDLKANNFTTLAVIDPSMHPQEEVCALLNIFEGEIRIGETESGKDKTKTLEVRRLAGQRFLENKIVLTKDQFST